MLRNVVLSMQCNNIDHEDVHLTLPPHIFFRPSTVTEHLTSRVSEGEFKIK